ncbi:BnaC03g76300D [Brassica napus]|uniref:BnaC03g76300D protein n=1 Tax=Brassica napus TaxID=3708 RepID=A0A078J5I3_BRANA|nr:BnaC03g76300D [Brassica napus]
MMIYRNQALKMNLDHLLSSSKRILKSYDGNMVDASRICFIVWKNMSEEVSLTLGSHIDLGNIPPGVSLPALKSLFIITIFFTYGDLCNVLLPGCPVLEELSICPACHLILTPASADVISPWVKRGLSLPVFKNLVALPYFPSFMFQALLKKTLA